MAFALADAGPGQVGEIEIYNLYDRETKSLELAYPPIKGSLIHDIYSVDN